ncbi:Pectin lyase-like superfamily protein [Euphorbia peplus]|nr:Pectin lyase-like superfamily protein [Euphorbia peplus]
MKIPLIFLSSLATFFFILDLTTSHNNLHLISKISLQPSAAPSTQIPEVSSPQPEPGHEPIYVAKIVLDVLAFGAAGNGVKDDTQALKMAWDSGCHSESPAVILVPAGYTFLIKPAIFTGPCKDGLVFQIDGSIIAPDGPKAWPKNVSKKQWLIFYRINGLSIQGQGLIDGRGDKWWNLPCKPHKKGINGTRLLGPCDSPVALRFFRSSNLRVEGLKVKNSPQFHFRFDVCENIEIEMLTVTAPSSSPNTDGIHIENTNNVHIYNSVISNGDDCVSIGAGCHNVDINNITCGPSHGISIGSLGSGNSHACVSNITVTNSVIKQSDNGVRIKTWQGGHGSVSKVTFHNIEMEKVRNPIIIDQYYCLTKNCKNQTSAVLIDDVSYTSIKGTYDVRSPALHLACSDSVPCSNIVLSEIELLPEKGQFMADPFCWNAYGAMESLIIPPVFCLMELIPPFVPQDIVHQC